MAYNQITGASVSLEKMLNLCFEIEVSGICYSMTDIDHQSDC